MNDTRNMAEEEDDLPQVEMMHVEAITSEPSRKVDEAPPPLMQQSD